jgi:hypothetical protein
MKPFTQFCIYAIPVAAGLLAWDVTGSVLTACCMASLLGAVFASASVITHAARHHRVKLPPLPADWKQPGHDAITVGLDEANAWTDIRKSYRSSTGRNVEYKRTEGKRP